MNNFQFDLKKALFQQKLGLSEHRQFQILETALRLIQKTGFEQLTFGDLAKKCKVSRSLIHHYYPDKFALATHLLELCTVHLQHHVKQNMNGETDTRQHLEIYCRATLNWAAEFRAEAAGLLLFLHLSSHYPEMRYRNDELSALGRQRIKLLLTQAGAPTNDIEDRAQSLQTLMTGAYLVLLSENLSEKESLKLRQRSLKSCMLIAFAK